MSSQMRAAERARTIIERAGEVVVSSLGTSGERVLHLALDCDGNVIVALPDEHPLVALADRHSAARAAAEQRGSSALAGFVFPLQRGKAKASVASKDDADSTVLLEAVDIIARPVADRIRARVVIIGKLARIEGAEADVARTLIHQLPPPHPTLSPASGAAAIAGILAQSPQDMAPEQREVAAREAHVLLKVTPQAIALGEPNRQGSVTLRPEDVARAMSDPLAPIEAALLDHIAIAHRPGLETMARQVSERIRARQSQIPRQRAPMGVDPVGLDRFGLTVRVWPDIMSAHTDVRLDFKEPVLNAAAALAHVERAMLDQSVATPSRTP